MLVAARVITTKIVEDGTFLAEINKDSKDHLRLIIVQKMKKASANT